MKRRTVLSLLPLPALAALTACSARDPHARPSTAAAPSDGGGADGASSAPSPSDEGGDAAAAGRPLPQSLASVRVSNLMDEATCEEVLGHLSKAGISEGRLTAFMEQVTSFHDTVPTASLIASGWAPLQDPTSRYDVGAMYDALTAANTRMTNCRITTWTLLQDLVAVAGGPAADTSQLFMDLDQIGVEPPLFDGDVQAGFDAVYGRVPTTSDKASEQHVRDIAAYFDGHGVSFPGIGTSMVSVFEHDTIDPQAYEFIGHVGVLVPAGEELLFVEKLAFEAPYQALLLESRRQLSDYLMYCYDAGPDVEYGRTLIIEDAQLIEGYRTLD